MSPPNTIDENCLRQLLVDWERATPHGVLSLNAGADTAAVRAQFLAYTHRYHPMRFARESAECRALANEVFLRVKGAYEAASKVADRTATPAPVLGQGSGAASAAAIPPKAARTPRVNRGQVDLLASRKPTSASTGSRSKTRGTPGNRSAPAQGAHMDMATGPSGTNAVRDQYKQAQRLLRERRFDAAVATLNDMISKVPANPQYVALRHFAMGRILEADGKKAEARLEYQEAVLRDASLLPAQDALRHLKRGFFSKLLGR